MSIVAIVGRPNVGKSTLFNRLVGMRKAIVNDTAGTTRDRHYGTSDWNGREFSVIDTGGYALGGEDVFEEEIRKQVVLAIEESDVVLFLVEVSTGITDLDMVIADLLRRSGKKVLLVVNKVDNNDLIYQSHEFYALGLGDPFCISTMSGSGTGDLLDAVIAALPEDATAEKVDDLPKFAIIGRPNVGKSSMTNALLDSERNIVTPVAGTTRDSILTRYNKFGMDFYLIDTAGLRKKNKVTEDLEFYSVLRSVRAIESSDVCILMLDASQGIESQDMNIFSTAPITFAQAALGGEMRINTVDGEVAYEVKPGTQTDTRIRLKGKGVPSLRNKNVRGDHYVTLVVQTPTNLNEEAKKALEAFDAACGNRPSEDSTSETSEKTEKKKKGFREKVKEMFEE